MLLDPNLASLQVSFYHLQVRYEEGRRRFHGAFTGGYSAGYYNTVGSKEGISLWGSHNDPVINLNFLRVWVLALWILCRVGTSVI